MELMTLNLSSTCCCGCEAENTIFMPRRPRRFGQGDELAMIGICKLRYMFCESRKFALEVIPAVNNEARPLLYSYRSLLRYRSVLGVPVSHHFVTRYRGSLYSLLYIICSTNNRITTEMP